MNEFFDVFFELIQLIYFIFKGFLDYWKTKDQEWTMDIFVSEIQINIINIKWNILIHSFTLTRQTHYVLLKLMYVTIIVYNNTYNAIKVVNTFILFH